MGDGKEAIHHPYRLLSGRILFTQVQQHFQKKNCFRMFQVQNCRSFLRQCFNATPSLWKRQGNHVFDVFILVAYLLVFWYRHEYTYK